MKIKIAMLLVALCAGCSDSNNSAKLDALTQKIDAITAKLDALPKSFSETGFFYYTNQQNMMFFIHSNTIHAMEGQEASIENVVNSETRRVGVIVFTNVTSFQADTLDALNEIKLHLH